jgi:FixJ family two-component response regulator
MKADITKITVTTHRRSVMEKINADSIADLAKMEESSAPHVLPARTFL